MKYLKLILIYALLKINAKYVFNILVKTTKENIEISFELKPFFKSVINKRPNTTSTLKNFKLFC